MENYATLKVREIPEAVRASYSDLRRDPYLEFRERYRRYANFKLRLSPDRNQVTISRLAHKPYYQSKTYHETLGDIDRQFEPIEADVTGIIAECTANVPLDVDRDYFLRVHQFRTLAKDEDSGKCVPEGPHRDGVEFAVMVSIDRQNIVGGASQILADKTASPMFETILEPGTALIVKDTDVYHNVTDIELVENAKLGHRDVLLWGYIPWEESRYKELYGELVEETKTIDVSAFREKALN